MAFEHLVFRARWEARVSKLASNIVMWYIPKIRKFKNVRPWMRLNHWLMMKYGYVTKDDGFKEL